MDVQKIREHRKESDGSYSVVYRETQADLVLTEDGSNMQEKINEFEPHKEEHVYTESGAHGIRYNANEGFLEVLNPPNEWITVDPSDAIKLESIKVKQNPSTTVYRAGENFNTSGMVITAVYTGGLEADVLGYTVNPTTLSSSTKQVTISYTEGTITKQCTVDVTVIYLTSIEVTSEPNLTEYKAGTTFNSTGMEITAVYSDNSSNVVTGYSLSPTTITSTTTQITVTYSEGDVTKQCTVPITLITLDSIAVATKPTTTTYKSGASFNKSGMVIKAYYTDGTSATITNYTYSPSSISSSTTQITISYTEGGITRTCTQAITVVTLSSISITTSPKLTYDYGERFSTSGLKIKATYSDGTTATYSEGATGLSTTPSNNTTLNHTHTTFTVKYTEGGVSKTATKTITINEILTGISVTSPPNTTDYAIGATWSKTGLVVTGTYSDGSTSNITSNCTFNPTTSTALTESHTSVTVTYSGFTTSFAISVSNALTSISITTKPDKLSYNVGEKFDTTGMIVTANYADGTSTPITSYTYSPTSAFTVSQIGDVTITVSYTDDGVTKTATVSVEVTIAGADVVLSNNSWETIAEVAALGAGQNMWSIGDITHAFNNSDFRVEIADFNHDTLTSTSSGYNNGSSKANITFISANTYDFQVGHYSTRGGASPYGWEYSGLRTFLNSSAVNANLYSPYGVADNENLIDNVVKSVKKQSYMLVTGTSSAADSCTTDDYFWAPSLWEIWPSSDISSNMSNEQASPNYPSNHTDGSRYSLFNTVTRITNTGTLIRYWTRTRALGADTSSTPRDTMYFAIDYYVTVPFYAEYASVTTVECRFGFCV